MPASSSSSSAPTRIGIIGTGFIARGLAALLRSAPDFVLAAALTRRDAAEGFAAEELVTSTEQFIERADIIVECSGDTLHATNVIDAALKAGRKVVTMNSEWHITVGSYFADKGYITEAEGDQAGCLAALHQETVAMGFKPLAYVNVKGYLNKLPERETMEFYAKASNISLDQVTSFTDGSKVQVEQAHVANGLGTDIIKTGLLGPEAATIKDAGIVLAEAAEKLGHPVADYVLTKDAPGAVYIVARHDGEQAGALK